MMGFYNVIPQILRKGIIAPLIAHLPSTTRNFSMEFKLRKFLEGADDTNMVRRHMRWLGTFNECERQKLFTEDLWRSIEKENVYKEAERAAAEANAHDERNKLLFAYQRSYMMDQVLVKVDRAGMQRSLETRAPFLDYQLVEFANRLPYKYKFRGMTTKYLLKKLMEGKLPNNIIRRQKKGFGVPIGEWLRGPLREWAEGLLSDDAPQKDGYIDLRYPRKLFSEHCSGKRDHRKKLWNILVFLEWQKHYCENKSSPLPSVE